MLVVPVRAVPSQTLNVVLGGQSCNINVYAKSTGLYLDLYVGSALIIGGVLCLDNTVIVRSAYLGFIGDLAFVDTQGADTPVYTGLGTRWVLMYFTPSDLAAFGVA